MARADSLLVGAVTGGRGDLRLKMEPGDTNVSDGLTKHLDERRMTNLLMDWLRVQ